MVGVGPPCGATAGRVIVLLDVNLSPRVAACLRGAGFMVSRVGEALDCRASDEAVLAEAVRTGAILVSQDQDFSAILATTGASRPSLVNVRLSDVDAARLAERIGMTLLALADNLANGAIATIDDTGVRVHALPVG